MYCIYKSEYGNFKIEYEGDYVVGISMVAGDEECMGKSSEASEVAFKQLCEYFAGERCKFEFAFKYSGTPFQEKVWKALIDIPYGATCSYSDIAIKIGHPKAFRAVGMANNKNPIQIVIPCHRVIGKSGALVGYAHGLDIKKFLLELEAKFK